MKPLFWVVGNWKMNERRESAVRLSAEIRAGGLERTDIRVVLCPPFPFLTQVNDEIRGSGLLLGAQDCAAQEDGAFTGEVSAAMLRDCGCACVILGHSERRRYQREFDAELSLKIAQARRAQLVPIYCVGETLEERRAGSTRAVIEKQLDKGLAAHLPPQGELLVAYEPVWAIGTGQNATPSQIGEVHAWIRSWLAQRAPNAADTIPILYGGSVKANNAADLAAVPQVDGFLVGGASLSAGEFLAIVRAGQEPRGKKGA